MSIPHSSRRTFLGLAALTPLAVLAGCGTSGPSTSGGASGGTSGGAATMWALSGQPNEDIQTKSVEAFNALGKGGLEVTFFQNDAYKTKIRTAVGADQAPTLIYGWGGGILKAYADAEQVLDLTSWLEENADFKDTFVDATWGSATFDDKVFAVPCNNTQPVVMYYNTKVFESAGADLPETWDDVLNLVDVFNGKGVAPFSLGGQSKWTSMMWMEYLLDRIGGPEAFNAIFAGEPDAWSNDAVIKTCEHVQELVNAKGFIKGFSSIAADSNADQALLYTGKAAMMLHGGWAYGGMKSEQPDFVAKSLQFSNFPSVEGGKGDPLNTVGNPANYWSVSAKASKEEQDVAKAYLTDGLFTDTDIDAYIASGGMPVVKAAQPKLGDSDDGAFLEFVYQLVDSAPNFQQSWDQALSPTQADTLLNQIDQLFLLQTKPEQFAEAMNATLGE